MSDLENDNELDFLNGSGPELDSAEESELEELEEEEIADEEEEVVVEKKKKKRAKLVKNAFIDDEAELSGDEDEISDDELELSDDDQVDLDLVDKEAKELDSDEEEEVRGLYHKQLETEDKRAILLLQEKLEDNDVSIGQRRRRKFRWQTKDLMENSLRRHYDPDDDDSQEGDDFDEDEDGDIDYDDLQPRLRRPTAESLLIGSTRIMTKKIDQPEEFFKSKSSFSDKFCSLTPVAAGSSINPTSDDSNSNTISSRLTATTTTGGASTKNNSDLNRFVFRDKGVVEALSTKETYITSRDEKEKVIQRELKRVIQSKSIFDQLYG